MCGVAPSPQSIEAPRKTRKRLIERGPVLLSAPQRGVQQEYKVTREPRWAVIGEQAHPLKEISCAPPGFANSKGSVSLIESY